MFFMPRENLSITDNAIIDVIEDIQTDGELITYAMIADELNISTRTVERRMPVLKATGYVRVLCGSKRKGGFQYVVLKG